MRRSLTAWILAVLLAASAFAGCKVKIETPERTPLPSETEKFGP